jgi:proteasome lid subunit RPN8/RPN11
VKLLLPTSVVDRIGVELRKSHWREIGGVFIGEHVEGVTFRIVDASIQRSGGTVTHFVRDPAKAREFLADWFKRTGNDYNRFNYIGEWHSHPRFVPLPSAEDNATMWDIVHDPDVGVNFLVLIIVRLTAFSNVQMSATLYRAGCPAETVEVVIERQSGRSKTTIFQRFRALLRWD